MILIIDCGSSKTPEIEKNLTAVKQHSITLKYTDTFDSSNQYKGIIISGAPTLVTELDPQPYIDKFLFLLSIEIPVLGICFGHQILGMVFGATAAKCKEARKPIEIIIQNELRIFNELNSSSSFSEDHCEMISLPKDFIQTASSLFCEIEGMQHKSKPLFGVQFHPETSDKNGIQLFKNFMKICDNKK
ncbi:MAG: gamma-glutamyl-gamma-aminobutyrate hydrolase family protein [Flavobacteriales bacterium]|nr:gamma-glutamyl-gamma-aminobutyrate hydrolase family protein [Flavobacteriales bacterium]